MNQEIGSYEAKTRLAELLRAVEQGQRYTITVRGKPVAELVPIGSTDRQKLTREEIIEGFQDLGRRMRERGYPGMSPEEIKAELHAGHRF